MLLPIPIKPTLFNPAPLCIAPKLSMLVMREAHTHVGRFSRHKLQFDLHKFPMPWHFSPSEIPEIFVDRCACVRSWVCSCVRAHLRINRMGFELLDAGQSRFFNDKSVG